jgi:hypothetical protein
VAALPPGSETLTDAALLADNATVPLADVSPIWAPADAGQSASAARAAHRVNMPELTVGFGRSPSQVFACQVPQATGVLGGVTSGVG